MVPHTGMLSVSVPGSVDVCFTALEKYGTMSFADLVQDAISLARDVVPISEKVARHMHTHLDKMRSYENLKKVYLNGEEPYHPGDIVKNPAYAKTLEYLAQYGKAGYYQGDIADEIVNYSNRHGGLFTKADFAQYHCDILKPVFTGYRNYTIYQTPPVSMGIIHLEEMAILNHFDMKQYAPDSAESIHLQVETKNIAFRDRVLYYGDPAFVTNPDLLANADYIRQMAESISMNSCLNLEEHYPFNNGHTTSMVAADKWGNAVSFIPSISDVWGSGELVPSLGFLLNDRAGSGFTLYEKDPNCIAPGKKTMHTLLTYMIKDKEGNLRYVGNTPGGDNQPQWNMQTVVNLIDYGMDVQSALENARWSDVYRPDATGKWVHTLKIESHAGEETIEKLRNMGHVLNVIEPYRCSGASQVIEIRPNGLLLGGSDPRADGAAMPEI